MCKRGPSIPETPNGPGRLLVDITKRMLHTVEQSTTYVEDVRRDGGRLQAEYQRLQKRDRERERDTL
eukprot:3568221-Amphidinium_carterae.1